MTKIKLKFTSFLVKILLLTIAMYFIHYTINANFLKNQTLQISLLKIYTFLFITISVFVYVLSDQGNKDETKILQTFLWLSMLKMVLVLVLLLPLFLNKSENLKTTIFHFFIPYFLYLILEILYSLKLLGLKK